MTDEPTEQTPLEKLDAAVAEFAQSQCEHPMHVVNAVVMWEQVRFDDEMRDMRAMRYACVGSDTISGALGLVEGTREYLRRDVLGERGDGIDPDDC